MRIYLCAAVLACVAVGSAQQAQNITTMTLRDASNKIRIWHNSDGVLKGAGTDSTRTVPGAQTFGIDSATGVGTFAGLGTTPLNASNLNSGTVPYARLVLSRQLSARQLSLWRLLTARLAMLTFRARPAFRCWGSRLRAEKSPA
jgi:hypothetical protein